MAQIVANEQRADLVLTSALTLGPTTAVSFDITNIQASCLIIYANVASGLPPGSASTGYVVNVFAIPPVGSVGDAANLLVANTVRSTTGTTVLKIGSGLPTTASVTVSTVNSFVPSNVRVTLSWSSAATSRSCVMSIVASFINY